MTAKREVAGGKQENASGQRPATPLDPPPNVRAIAKRLEDAGFETWCVGGAVRDALLGHPHLDWDLATAAKPEQVRKLFKRTVPVGVEFGTIGVLDDDNVMHEVTTFRRDVQTDGRHAVVEFGASLDDDLARRDYTINAIAYSPSNGEIRDPFGGQKDIEGKLIRAVGDPGERMREDRLRALRAIRFASRFGFDIERDTWDAIVESAPELGKLSAERVKQEIEKTMDQVKFPSKAFAMWRDTGAFQTLIPALAGVTNQELAPLDHLRRPLLPRRPARRSTRIAGLFATVPAATVHKTLKDLRFSNTDVDWITKLVQGWQQLGPGMTAALLKAEEIYANDPWGEQYPPSAVLRRWAKDVGSTRLAPLLRLADAFWWAGRQAGEPAPYKQTIGQVYKRAIRIAYRDPIALSDLAIDGTDLEKLGVKGPAVGNILRKLLDVVIDDPRKNTHDQLLTMAKGLV